MPVVTGGASIVTFTVVLAATAGVIVRPWRLPEGAWAIGGAVLLVLLGLLPWSAALAAVGRGTDVYLFLLGMMLLSEAARREDLFGWLAAFAVRGARGSARRLFVLVYAVGTVVTVFLSNDAAAVVLTPAVLAAARAAGAEPLPYLFACAFVANAASFVLPISNPANLVLYGNHVPPLSAWLGRFLLPAALSVAATLLALVLVERRCLSGRIEAGIPQPRLASGGRTALAGLILTALVLLGASAAGVALGLPTCLCGLGTVAVVLLARREAPWRLARGISWTVLPLVAGLFVLVSGLDRTGALPALANTLHRAAQAGTGPTAWACGIGLALLCNLTNNLPAGLVAAQAAIQGQLPRPVVDALLVGVDLGPNLSITGSLATILWLAALRRDGLDVSFGHFLARGLLVMPPALLPALAALLLR